MSEPFTITQTFDAPSAELWATWTEPARIAAWMGPAGSGAGKVHRHELRPGGVLHSSYDPPGGGPTMWGKHVYREVIPMERLVWEHSFSDEAGGVTRHPMAPLWPLILLTTVTFADAGQGRSSLTLTWDPLDASDAERLTFEAAKPGMTAGWSGSFAALAAYLADH